MAPTDDHLHLERFAQTGSELAFQVLVERHLPLVWGTACRATRDPCAADDIAQVVFALLARKASSISSRVRLQGWLHRATTLESLQYLRTNRRRSERERFHMEVDSSGLSKSPASPDIPMDPMMALLPVLDAALVELKEGDREALYLRFFSNASFTEIGKRLGTTEDGAQKRVSRALEKLRTSFQQKGIRASAGLLAAACQCAASTPSPPIPASSIASKALISHTASVAPFSTWLAMKLQIAAVTFAVTSTAAVWWLSASSQPMESRIRIEPARTETTPFVSASANTTPPSSPVDWSQIESSDYLQYVANLRAIGCPEEVIRDLIIADVQKHFAAQYKPHMVPEPTREFWKKPQPRPPTPPGLGQLQRRLSEEHRATVEAVLGEPYDPMSFINRLWFQTSPQLVASLGFVSEDKWQAAMRSFQSNGLETREAEERDLSTHDYERTENQILERRLSAMEGILSPEELTEFRRRSSSWMQTLFQALSYFDGTEIEFEKLARLHEANQPLRMIFWGNEPMTGVQSALGAERYQDLLRAVDPTYQFSRMAAERHQLPEETALQAYDLKSTTIREANQILAQPNLSSNQRAERLQHLRERAEERWKVAVGTNAFRMIRNLGGTKWMDHLGEP